jgi:hypothetical protein
LVLLRFKKWFGNSVAHLAASTQNRYNSHQIS